MINVLDKKDPLYNNKMSILLELERLDKEVYGYAPDDDYLDIMEDLEIEISNLYKKVNMVDTVYILFTYSDDYDNSVLGVFQSLEKAKEKRQEYINKNLISEDMILINEQHIIR